MLASSPRKDSSAAPAAFLPNDLPGQANSSSNSSTAAEKSFSLFAAPPAAPQQLVRPEQQAGFRDPQLSAREQQVCQSSHTVLQSPILQSSEKYAVSHLTDLAARATVI